MVSSLRDYWLLDRQVTFLNHGSYGACPIAVLERQQQWRQELEVEPVRFIKDRLEPALDKARTTLARFVGAKPDNLVFVPNATTGVNSVLRSLRFAPGDELLATNHAYNACRNALNFVAERWQAQVVVAEVPFPLQESGQVTAEILAKCSEQTRLVLVDHVSSQTALIFPLAELVNQLESWGIPVLVDGAHAPGMVPLALDALGASFYTGNCHKWLCAPKGSAFLHVRSDWQDKIRPLTISHGANAPDCDRPRWHLEFDWVGTMDPTPWLCVSTVIEHLASLVPGGWPEIMTRNHQLAAQARRILAEQLRQPLPCPDKMIGSIASVPLPDGDALELMHRLFEEFRIEVPVFAWPRSPQRWLRISAQLYNHLADYEQLGTALHHCLD